MSLILLKNSNSENNSIITITNVKTSRDLRISKIYFSIYNKDESIIKKEFSLLIKNIKNFKYLLGKKLQSKYVPQIQFHYDEQYKIYDEINLLSKQ